MIWYLSVISSMRISTCTLCNIICKSNPGRSTANIRNNNHHIFLAWSTVSSLFLLLPSPPSRIFWQDSPWRMHSRRRWGTPTTSQAQKSEQVFPGRKTFPGFSNMSWIRGCRVWFDSWFPLSSMFRSYSSGHWF